MDGGLSETDGIAAARRSTPASAATPGQSAAAPLQGYLTKQGHRVKNWKRRWFSLEGGVLRYYDSKGDAKVKGEVRARRS